MPRLSGYVLASIVRVVFTLGAFALGVYGFHEAYRDIGGPGHTLGDNAYKSMQLVVGQFPTELIGRDLPLSLLIARFAVPLSTFWTAVALAWRQARNPVRLRLIRMRGEHLIVAGDRGVAARVAMGEVKAKRPVIIWTKDAREQWVQDAEDAGAAHAPEVDKLGLAKARSVLIAGPDDAANIALAASAIDTALEERLAGDPLTIIARIDDPDLRAPLERRYDWGNERSLVRMRFASLPDIGAREIFVKMPLDRFQRGDLVDRGVFFVGFSPTVERYVIRLLAAAHFSGGAKPRIVVLDAAAARKRDVFFARRPGAAALAPVVFVEAAVDQPALLGKAFDAAVETYGAPTAVFVDPDEGARALTVAIAVEERFRAGGGIAPPIYVRLPEETADAELACEIVPIGGVDSLADPELLLQERLDALARATHEFYLEGRLEEGDQIGSRGSMYEWDQLSEAFRDENRLVTDGYVLKMRDVGARLVPGAQGAGGFRFEDEELEALSRAEHDRWMSSKLIEGWVFGEKRDDAAKIHPDIIPYDDLTEARKDLDREQIKIITRLLSTTGRRAVRDLVIALEPGADGAVLVSKAILDQIAAQYPDRALVVLGAFDDEASRTAMLAAQTWGAIVQLTVSNDPENIVSRRPRAERGVLRKLYRHADRIFALPKDEWPAERRQGFVLRRAHLRLVGGSAPAASDVPVVRVDSRGAIAAAPWTR